MELLQVTALKPSQVCFSQNQQFLTMRTIFCQLLIRKILEELHFILTTFPWCPAPSPTPKWPSTAYLAGAAASQELHLPQPGLARVSTDGISLARLPHNSWQSWCVHGHKEGFVCLKFPRWEGSRQPLVFSLIVILQHCLKTWQWVQAAAVMGWETARKTQRTQRLC